MKASNPCDLVLKKRDFYNRMRNDIEFRLQQVDKKIMTMNALSATYYTRYQMEVYDDQGNTYDIGEVGQLILNKDE